MNDSQAESVRNKSKVSSIVFKADRMGSHSSCSSEWACVEVSAGMTQLSFICFLFFANWYSSEGFQLRMRIRLPNFTMYKMSWFSINWARLIHVGKSTKFCRSRNLWQSWWTGRGPRRGLIMHDHFDLPENVSEVSKVTAFLQLCPL